MSGPLARSGLVDDWGGALPCGWRSTMKIIIFMCNSLSSYKTVLDARQTILLSRRFNMGRRRHVHLEMWRWSTQSGGEEHGQNSHTEYGPCASRNGCDEAATGANRNASRRTFEWIIQRIKVSRYHLLTWVQTPAAALRLCTVLYASICSSSVAVHP